MIVIEGRARKSTKLIEYVKDKYKNLDDVAIISSIADAHDLSFTFEESYLYENEDINILIKMFVEDYHYYKGKYKLISFYFNAPVNFIDEFKELEKSIEEDVIVTIQNNDLEYVKIYEV